MDLGNLFGIFLGFDSWFVINDQMDSVCSHELTFDLQQEDFLLLHDSFFIVELKRVISWILGLNLAEAQRPVLQQLTAAMMTFGGFVVKQEAEVSPPEVSSGPHHPPQQAGLQHHTLTAIFKHLDDLNRVSWGQRSHINRKSEVSTSTIQQVLHWSHFLWSSFIQTNLTSKQKVYDKRDAKCQGIATEIV